MADTDTAHTANAAAGRLPRTRPLIRPPGMLGRIATTTRHVIGLLVGGFVAWTRSHGEAGGRGPLRLLLRLVAIVVTPLVSHRLVGQPFPVQLRRRFERLGPTYIKLGQMLSLRSDLLPESVTSELATLLDNVPALPFEVVLATVERDLGRPPEEIFAAIGSDPVGSASIAQAHRATTAAGDDVILKVVRPGLRETLRRDGRILAAVGRLLEVPLGRYQPSRIINEFTHYTQQEADMTREAANAETLADDFRDLPTVVFPRIFREYSGRDVLCMEFLDGIKPSSPEALALPEAERERLIDTGAAAIIRMLYRDGLFHADLHPSNLLILPGGRIGFIDLGMVGYLHEELRRTLLYYYYCLVTGDVENAARYLASIAEPAAGGDLAGFRRDVVDISRRWRRSATFRGFSLAHLVLASVSRAGQHRVNLPVELVLMVKALITYEAVGHMLLPDFDVAAVSKPHITRVFAGQFNPIRMAREGLRAVPELMDALVKAPELVSEGVRLLERSARTPPPRPLSGFRGTVLAGFFLVAGAILATSRQSELLALPLLALALVLILYRDR